MLTIGFKEILVIVAIIGALLWMRMFRNTMDRETTRFFHKLKGPEGGGGFGWRGILVAFVVGMVACCAMGYFIFRIWTFYHRASGG